MCFDHLKYSETELALSFYSILSGTVFFYAFIEDKAIFVSIVKLGVLLPLGFWYSPECEFTRHCIDKSQENVDGTVTIEVYKGRVSIKSRHSAVSLYNEELVRLEFRDPLTLPVPCTALGLSVISTSVFTFSS